ncbi:MAG: hypothetical protein AABO58_16485 [Acidobacteriota bacterium]
MQSFDEITEEFCRALADLRQALPADTDALEYVEGGVQLLSILRRTAEQLDQRTVPDETAQSMLGALIPLMNQRLTWMNAYRNTPTLTESDLSPARRAASLPLEMRERFAALTGEQQYDRTGLRDNHGSCRRAPAR